MSPVNPYLPHILDLLTIKSPIFIDQRQVECEVNQKLHGMMHPKRVSSFSTTDGDETEGFKAVPATCLVLKLIASSDLYVLRRTAS
jgi:hypothetical protein